MEMTCPHAKDAGQARGHARCSHVAFEACSDALITARAKKSLTTDFATTRPRRTH